LNVENRGACLGVLRDLGVDKGICHAEP
jgi:hypothetical protein